MPNAPARALTDWTTVAGLDGAGQLALVTGGATPEGIHLATLGYEVFVLHASDADASTAETAQHVHHVAADPTGLPQQWAERFGLVVALDGQIPVEVLAPNALAVAVADRPIELPGLTTVVCQPVADQPERYRTVLARLIQ